jgi:PD-(D/E)XK endonuclease
VISDKSHIIGRAAEYFVCYDLSKRGIRASLSPFEQAPYDVLAEHNGRLLTIQVKGTGEPHRPRQYRFTFSKKVEADLIAFVALDTEKIHYKAVGEHKQSLWIPVDEFKEDKDDALMKAFDLEGMFTKNSPKKPAKPSQLFVFNR